MKITRILALGVLAASLGLGLQVGPGAAQIREQQPAEFPPASYKGKQYVDSNGCVFIRAGIDGDVAWVPRVSRDRKVICGFRPSLADTVAEAPAPVQTAEAAAAPVITPVPEVRQAAPAPRPAPRVTKPRVVRQTAPKPKRQPRVAAAPKPRPPEQVRLVVKVPKGSLCPGASPQAQPYLRGTGMRCGPQDQPVVRVVTGDGTQVTKVVPSTAPTATVVAAEPAWAQTLTTETRIVPKHVAENRINTRNVAVPKGYRPVWDDDRLNPYRAEQNLQGRADMLLIWTQTVPRRLIDRRTGQDVTAKLPLIYPYTSIAQQRAAVGEVMLVQRDGQVMKKVVRKPVYSSRSAPQAVAPKKTLRQQAVSQQPVPKQSAPRAQPLAAPRYVQVGTYRQEANARRAAQTVAGMGMRARIGKNRGGAGHMVVEAGPFADAGSLQTAVRRLRGAGYGDAFVK